MQRFARIEGGIVANVVEAQQAPEGWLPCGDAAPGWAYDETTGVFTPPQVESAGKRVVSVLAFRRRFTPAERAAIEWAAVDRPDQPEANRIQAAALRASLADQAVATFIEMEDRDTITGVQTIEAAGMIASGRAVEILTAPVQPEERP